MKKMMFVLLVAALAASVHAQVLSGGQTQQSQPQQNQGQVNQTQQSSGGDIVIDAHAWADTRIQSSVQALDDDELAENTDADAIVLAKLKGEAGVRALFGDYFYMKSMFFYDIGKTGLSSATLIGGIGVELDPVSFGVNIGTDMTTFKGFKLGADVSWEIIPEGLTIFGWGNATLNGGKNKIISTAGAYADGTRDYTAFDAGIGIDVFAVQGLYFGLIGSVYGNNNEWVTAQGQKTTTSSEIRGKIGFVQDGRLFYIGLGWRGGESILDAATTPKTSSEVLIEVGFKLQ